MARIDDFVEALPLGYDTVIGMEGKGVSQGQRQRILIARAIYKNPEYIFLDEATNSLDATNEAQRTYGGGQCASPEYRKGCRPNHRDGQGKDCGARQPSKLVGKTGQVL